MKFVYVSNYMNHHVKPLCDELYKALGDDFCFIQTDEMTAERKALGWSDAAPPPPYVKEYMSDKMLCNQLILDSDIAVIGWSSLPFEIMEKRFTNGKPAFRQSERIYKEGQWKRFSPRGLKAKEKEHGAFRGYPVSLLCVGAYVASDFERIGCYPGRKYRWGYFTEVNSCDMKQWQDTQVLQLLWAGRMMDLKHPEYALEAAALLKKEGIPFKLKMVGDGALRTGLEKKCRDLNLEKEVSFYGALPAEQVRTLMQEAQIFLFTSNYLEGWGAVVGEAMSSACCVVASAEAGAVPFLIRDGVNGLTYADGSFRAFARKLTEVARDPAFAKKLGLAARETMASEWNATCAARRLLQLSDELLEKYACREAMQSQEEGRHEVTLWSDEGPMSPAPILKAQSFFRTLQEKNRQDNGRGPV